MAKGKKQRQDKTAAKATAKSARSQREATPASEKTVEPRCPGAEVSPPEEAANQQQCQRKVSVGTCLGGMALTLVLGLYLGTLLPDALGTRQQHVATQTAAPPESAQAAPAGLTDPQLKKLVADLEKRAAASPDSAPDWINLGNAYFDAHMPKEAITAYEHALRLAPRNADVLTDLGIMYRETGDFTRAIASFRKALAIDPGHQNAMFNEGVVLSSDLHKNAEAAAAWQRLLEVNPHAKAPNGAPLADMIQQLR